MASADIDQLISAIREDRQSGASQLARRVLEILEEYARSWAGTDRDQFQQEMIHLARALQGTRPSMCVIQNIVTSWLAHWDSGREPPLKTSRSSAIDTSTRLKKEMTRASQATVKNMVELIRPGDVLMTHSLSSTVSAVFDAIKELGVEAIVTESRPLEEGQLLARHLSRLGITTTYITDAQMGIWVKRASRVIVGADSVLNDGSVVNKAGTSLLAHAAHEHGIPFTVCCETLKYAADPEARIILEESSSDELGFERLPHVNIRNTYFDITDSAYVSSWVSEEGVREQWDSSDLLASGSGSE